ncbi:hypothetical protein PIB30_042150 [Stylosanthes scabra]|uniref:Uncharacterized protein n=1 Tax=Stylosanthes scabra TaxID=79078 RepID=A0ABU6ZDX4_9FABA|nr:hypothetical protein [Stylosanthes scabra]
MSGLVEQHFILGAQRTVHILSVGKNEERKLEEQERKNLEHSVRVSTPRRGHSRLGVQSHFSRPNHQRLGVAHQPQAPQGHSKPTPRRPTQRLGVTKHPEAQL